MLAFVPGGADAELGTAAGENVESGDDLGQQTRVAVGDAGDEQPESHRLGLSGEETERRVPLEHRVFCGGHHLHLEPAFTRSASI